MTHRSVGSYARNIVGPASRNFDQAASGQVRDFYAYVLEDKLNNPEVYLSGRPFLWCIVLIS